MHILDLTIKEIHLALVEKRITPLQLAKEAIKRAKENLDNAFETIDEEGALAFASTLEEPEVDNLFWGIPVVLKDNISTKGLLTTGSSEILKDYIPVFDATIVKKLKEAKAVIIAKSTLDELAMGGTGTTGHLGVTFNPYDPSHTHIIGGSSCGSAVAVADAIVPMAVGSDTGDSVRKPASYGGLVGFKPTWGRISRYGIFPFAPSMDHVAYFTRSVEDAAITLNLLAGHDYNDATSSFKDVEDYCSLIGKDIKGKKIAVIDDIVNTITSKEIVSKFNESLSWLEAKGAIIEHISFGKSLLESILPTYMVISCAEATSNNANLDGIKFGPRYGGSTYEEVMINARTKGFSELIKRRFVIGSYVLMKQNQDKLFLKAQRNRHKIVDRLNEILSECDVIYLPATPTIAPEINASTNRLSSEHLIADNHLALGNFAGLPSITVPLGFFEGMPFGANIMGKAFFEAEVLQIAKQLEDATGLYNLSVRRVK